MLPSRVEGLPSDPKPQTPNLKPQTLQVCLAHTKVNPVSEANTARNGSSLGLRGTGLRFGILGLGFGVVGVGASRAARRLVRSLLGFWVQSLVFGVWAGGSPPFPPLPSPPLSPLGQLPRTGQCLPWSSRPSPPEPFSRPRQLRCSPRLRTPSRERERTPSVKRCGQRHNRLRALRDCLINS